MEFFHYLGASNSAWLPVIEQYGREWQTGKVGMRRVFFTIFTLVLAITIAISACKAEGLDPGRLDLLRARILDGTFKDINGIIVVKHGKIFIEEYFN